MGLYYPKFWFPTQGLIESIDMFIYNVTTHVEPAIEKDWLMWMQEEHLPQMLATGHFTLAKLFRVVTQEDVGGISYAAQYHCKERADFSNYLMLDAERLREISNKRFGSKTLSFRTELEEIITVK